MVGVIENFHIFMNVSRMIGAQLGNVFLNDVESLILMIYARATITAIVHIIAMVVGVNLKLMSGHRVLTLSRVMNVNQENVDLDLVI